MGELGWLVGWLVGWFVCLFVCLSVCLFVCFVDAFSTLQFLSSYESNTYNHYHQNYEEARCTSCCLRVHYADHKLTLMFVGSLLVGHRITNPELTASNSKQLLKSKQQPETLFE